MQLFDSADSKNNNNFKKCFINNVLSIKLIKQQKNLKYVIIINVYNLYLVIKINEGYKDL